ncbi:MAG: hypothetical protein ACE5I5_07630 [Candidatus Heimdallarchaeota archaeon]
MSESEKQQIPTWNVAVKKGVSLQIKAFKREDGSKFILLIGRGRHFY